LSHTIRHQAPFPVVRVIRIAAQIARALGVAHDKGIVHRDLKPENVFLVDRDNRPDFVKIVDFGIAKVAPLPGDANPNQPRLTKAGSVFGTPEYMAPEQAAGRNDTDRRVDIYALGTILYEMTCGRTPHKSKSLVRTIAMQILDPITPLGEVVPGVHPALERVVMKALTKPRDERYQTMPELATALEGVLVELAQPVASRSLPPMPPGADPITEPPPPTITPPPRRAKGLTRPLHEPEFAARGPITVLPQPTIDPEPPDESRRWPVAAITLVLLAGGGGAVWYASRRSDVPVVVETPRDGGVIAMRDAQVIVELDDARVTPTDARAIALVPFDAGHSTTVPLPGPHPDTMTIEVLTRPAEANVFVGHTFRGPSGTKLTEPWGTKLSIECRAPHYKGRTELVFDGSRDSIMCTAIRLPMCVHGLKNPYDECDP
jgi:hypothetical protein